MNDPSKKADPTNSRRGMYDEADIGSGEKTPAQHETEEMIRQIPPLPPSNRQSGEAAPARGEGEQGNGAPAQDGGSRQGA